MAYNGTYFVQDDFLGGYCGAFPSSDLTLNQASDLDNVVVGPGGKYVRTLWPTIRINATEFGDTSNQYPVIGVGVFQPSSQGNANMLVVRNGKAWGTTYAPPNVRDGATTFVDRTGAVTIATGVAKENDYYYDRWNFCQFDDILVGFGGADNAQEAPFKWVGGANNIAALGGSPPSALFGFSANNRLFACRTAANPHTVYWSILGNAEDWTGTGSGSAVIGSLEDDAGITAAVPIGNNVVLVFKKTAIYQMNISTHPFPNFLLFDGIGTINSRSAVAVGGVVYFLDIRGRLHSTDGNTITDYPDAALNLTGNITSSYYDPFPFAYRKTGDDYDWLVFCFRDITDISGAGWPTSVVWDLRNKLWLRCSTNFGFLTGAYSASGDFYGASPVSGRIFMPDCSASGTNDSDDLSTITSYWRTGWITPKILDKITQIDRVGLNLKLRPVAGGTTSGGWQVDYGFNFVQDTQQTSILATADTLNVGLQPQAIRFVFLKGKGASQQLKFTWIGSNVNNMGAQINSIVYAGKPAGIRSNL